MRTASDDRTSYLAPWVWPDPNRFPSEFAQWSRSCPEGPGPTRPGEVLLVAVCDRSAILWGLGVEGADIEMGREADQAWKDARTALLRHVAYLWERVSRWAGEPPRARKVAAFVPDGACEHPSPRVGGLDGASFGLAFLLAQASGLYGLPVEARFAAMAAVESNGTVMPVGDIRLKVRAVLQKAWSVRTILVAPSNAEEAREVAYGTGVEVVPVSSAAQALEVVFGDRPVARLADLLRDPGGRRAVVSSLFDMTLRGDRGVVNWEPVARAAERVQHLLDGPSNDETFRLEFARAVALRHQSNRGLIPVFDETVLRALPAPIRLELVSHLVQHSADTGVPSSEDAERLANDHLVIGPEAFREHLRLQASLGRLLAVTGRPEQALDHEISAVEGLLVRMDWAEVSRPLSMAMRLAGVLGRDEEFERLSRIRRTLGEEGLISSRDRQYLDLAWCAGRSFLGKPDAEVLTALERLAREKDIPAHVRFSAIRFAIQVAGILGRWGDAQAWRGHLETAAREEAASREGDAAISLALVRLDADPMDPGAIEVLRNLDPGVISHLERAGRREGIPSGIYITKYYPY